eukprot:6335152-Prymnesium_polylepis.1
MVRIAPDSTRTLFINVGRLPDGQLLAGLWTSGKPIPKRGRNVDGVQTEGIVTKQVKFAYAAATEVYFVLLDPEMFAQLPALVELMRALKPSFHIPGVTASFVGNVAKTIGIRFGNCTESQYDKSTNRQKVGAGGPELFGMRDIMLGHLSSRKVMEHALPDDIYQKMLDMSARSTNMSAVYDALGHEPVSYTHLTLPTICSV